MTLTNDKHAGHNIYLDLMQSGVTNPDHPWENPMHSLDEKITQRIEDDNKGVVVITPDKIRTTILITDEGDSLKQKNFNTTCLLSEADIQRLCKKNAICKERNGMLTDNLGRLYMPESNLL